MNQELICHKHNQTVTSLCTFKECNFQRVCCNTCSLDHKKHQAFVSNLQVFKEKYYVHNHTSMKYIQQLRQQNNELIDNIEAEIQDSRLIPVFPTDINYNNLSHFAIQVAYLSNSYPIIGYLEFAIMHIEAVLKRILLIIPQEIESMGKQAQAFQKALKAQQFYEDGEYKQALEYINDALQISNRNDRLFYYKGLALQGLKRHVEAVNCFNKAIELQPQYTAYYAKKALSLNELKVYQTALEAADKGCKLDYTYGPNWQEQVRALQALNRIDEATQCQLKALQMKPEWASVEQQGNDYRNQGFQLHNQGRFEEAIQFYNKCIELSSDDNVALNNKAVTLFTMKKYEESIKCLHQAISIVNINPNYYSNKAHCLNQLGRYDEALASIEIGLQLNSKHIYSWNERGRALLAKGKPNEALKCYTSYL